MSTPLEITVRIGPKGLQIKSSIDDPVTCLGVLDLAKSQITNTVLGSGAQAKPAPKIQTVHGIDASALRTRNGK